MPHLAFKSKATRIHSSGQVWATLLGYGTFAMVLEMMLGSLPVLAGLLPIGKGWAEVYFYRNRLITEGVYGVVRHPQYAGIFLVIFGQLVHCPTIPTLLASAHFSLVALAPTRMPLRRKPNECLSFRQVEGSRP
jgi:protein-S-isoprenylcysteine O-methyltransferase Ste14